MSGIMGGLINSARGEAGWRLAFPAGLFAAPPAYGGFGGVLPKVTVNAPLWLVTIAGLIVGFGARLGAGCRIGTASAGSGVARHGPSTRRPLFMATAILRV